MVVLGIDPGQTGGLALIKSYDDGRLPLLLGGLPMPLYTCMTKKPCMSYPVARKWLEKFEDTIHTGVIENVHAMPAQGVSSSFQFGRMFGASEVLIHEFSQNAIEYVTPQVWKKHFELGTDKKHSVEVATELYHDTYWPLKKHEGVAEAALIATWGLHKLLEQE